MLVEFVKGVTTMCSMDQSIRNCRRYDDFVKNQTCVYGMWIKISNLVRSSYETFHLVRQGVRAWKQTKKVGLVSSNNCYRYLAPDIIAFCGFAVVVEISIVQSREVPSGTMIKTPLRALYLTPTRRKQGPNRKPLLRAFSRTLPKNSNRWRSLVKYVLKGPIFSLAVDYIIDRSEASRG